MLTVVYKIFAILSIMCLASYCLDFAKALFWGLKMRFEVWEQEAYDKLKKIVNDYTIFGRVTPYQKQSIIRALKEKNTVGMIGDGVNDFLGVLLILYLSLSTLLSLLVDVDEKLFDKNSIFFQCSSFRYHNCPF